MSCMEYLVTLLKAHVTRPHFSLFFYYKMRPTMSGRSIFTCFYIISCRWWSSYLFFIFYIFMFSFSFFLFGMHFFFCLNFNSFNIIFIFSVFGTMPLKYFSYLARIFFLLFSNSSYYLPCYILYCSMVYLILY